MNMVLLRGVQSCRDSFEMLCAGLHPGTQHQMKTLTTTRMSASPSMSAGQGAKKNRARFVPMSLVRLAVPLRRHRLIANVAGQVNAPWRGRSC